MLLIDCNLLAKVGLFTLYFVVKLNHEKEPSTEAPYVVRVYEIMVNKVLTDARVLLDLEGGVGLQ
jgi:hypothetical protein